jgi:flavin-dependent thymidylate synthase
MSNVQGWADAHQYDAAPMAANRDEQGNILPKVTLLWMNPDPLGAVAAMCRMYEGIPTYDLTSIMDYDRVRYFEQVQKTHLKAPLEAIKMHFFIEGVTRSFTHQMVRQRTAVYAQESMRFAVKENMADEISTPPSIAALAKNHPTRQKWDEAIAKASETYNFLVANGIPAEDARGLAPHATTTRLNYSTDLRNLAEHAGNRLCTQAQFEWRIVFMGIVSAIRDYGHTPNGQGTRQLGIPWANKHSWQFKEIANSPLFRPICYQTGRCMFHADFDRSCTIRDRVDHFASIGLPSSRWHETNPDHHYKGIDPAEWMLDPAAARKTSGGGGHD